MKVKSSSISFFSICLFSVFFVFGCSKKEEKDVKKKEVVIFSNVFSKASEKEFFVNKILYPLGKDMGVDIKYLEIEGISGLKNMEARSEQYRISADIELGPFGTMADLIEDNYLTDLSIETKFWKEMDVIPAFRNGIGTYQRRFFMPIIGNIFVMIINKKALPFLPKGADINHLTWEQFVEWAINMKNSNGYGRTVLSGISLSSFIYQFGSCALSYGGSFPDINSEGARKAWKIFQKIADANAFVPNIRIVGDCTTVLQTNQAWLSVINSTRACEVFLMDPDNFIVAPMPKGDQGRGAIVGFAGMAVMKNSKSRETALKILEYFSDPKVQMEVARGTGGFFPASLEALKFLNTKKKQDVIIKKSVDELNGSDIIISNVPSQDYIKWDVVKQLFDNIFQNIILSKKELSDNDLNSAAKELELLKKH